MSNKQERLKKLQALALRGVGGEKEQAEALLAKLSKKYGVSIDELDEEVEREYRFKYSGKAEEKLLMQIVYKVTNESGRMFEYKYTASGRTCRNTLGAMCTEAQKIEIEFLFDFYKRLYEKEVKALLGAFIQKHELFGQLKEGEKAREISDEERKKLFAMMNGLSDESPRLQIESGENCAK